MTPEWLATLPKVKDASGFRAEVRTLMEETGHEFNSDLVRQNLSGRVSGDLGLFRRSGNLARGWNTSAIDTGDSIVLRNWISGPASAYATKQEFGGDITPQRARFLWVPLSANLTGTGMARITPTEAISQGGFIRWNGQNGPVFYGAPLLKGQAKGMGPHIVPLFALKKKVHIPARMGATTLFTRKWEQLGAKITFIAGDYL